MCVYKLDIDIGYIEVLLGTNSEADQHEDFNTNCILKKNEECFKLTILKM